MEVPSLRTCSGDLSWFGPGRLQDSQGPEVLLAPGPSGLNVSKPGWTGQRTPAPPCQASLALLYNQGAFQLQHFPLSRKPQRKSLLISSRSRGGGSIRRLSGPLGRRQHVLCCRGGWAQRLARSLGMAGKTGPKPRSSALSALFQSKPLRADQSRMAASWHKPFLLHVIPAHCDLAATPGALPSTWEESWLPKS